MFQSKRIKSTLTFISIICVTTLMLASVSYATIERVYTVISAYGKVYDGKYTIRIKGQSGNTFDVYYSSPIGVDVGYKVIVLFDDKDETWLRISNANTGVSATILSVERVY